MYPDLSYIFHDLFGSEPDGFLSILKTFGFFLAIAFLASALVFYVELKRKSAEGFYVPENVEIVEGAPASLGELISNAVVGLIMGGKGVYAYLHYAEFKSNPASVVLSAKMHWPGALIGALLLGGLTWWDARRKQKTEPVRKQVPMYPYHRISELTVAAAIGGILGAKIFDIFDNWDSFLADPIGSLTSGGGLAFFGGLILGFAAVVGYMYRKNIPFLPTADAVAPSLATGYGVGRIGCQLSGDGDWGIVNNSPKPGWMSFLPDWMWGYKYPHNVLNYTNTDPVHSVAIPDCKWQYCKELAEPVFPTPFYEVVMMAAIFGILWMLRKRVKPVGMLFFIYLCLIAVERFLIEKIRVNVEHDVLGMVMTQAEIISVVIFMIGLAGIWWTWNRHNKRISTDNG